MLKSLFCRYISVYILERDVYVLINAKYLGRNTMETLSMRNSQLNRCARAQLFQNDQDVVVD